MKTQNESINEIYEKYKDTGVSKADVENKFNEVSLLWKGAGLEGDNLLIRATNLTSAYFKNLNSRGFSTKNFECFVIGDTGIVNESRQAIISKVMDEYNNSGSVGKFNNKDGKEYNVVKYKNNSYAINGDKVYFIYQNKLIEQKDSSDVKVYGLIEDSGMVKLSIIRYFDDAISKYKEVTPFKLYKVNARQLTSKFHDMMMLSSPTFISPQNVDLVQSNNLINSLKEYTCGIESVDTYLTTLPEAKNKILRGFGIFKGRIIGLTKTSNKYLFSLLPKDDSKQLNFNVNVTAPLSQSLDSRFSDGSLVSIVGRAFVSKPVDEASDKTIVITGYSVLEDSNPLEVVKPIANVSPEMVGDSSEGDGVEIF